MNVNGVRITASGITVAGPQGPVFENVDAHIRPGDLATVTGPSGTGRTSLLLTLSGRMRMVAGQLHVSGYALPKQARHVRRLVVPARVRPGFELEPGFLVREAVRERQLITGITTEDVERAFALVGIDPEPQALVAELHPGERLLLAVALAVADPPAGVLVDDVELGLPHPARTRVWAALHAVAKTGTTVLASSPDPPQADDGAAIRLPYSQTSQETTRGFEVATSPDTLTFGTRPDIGAQPLGSADTTQDFAAPEPDDRSTGDATSTQHDSTPNQDEDPQ